MDRNRLAQEMKKNMIRQGLNPLIIKSYLEESTQLQRKKFETVRQKLSEKDRDKAELILLQGELLLAVIDRCSH